MIYCNAPEVCWWHNDRPFRRQLGEANAIGFQTPSTPFVFEAGGVDSKDLDPLGDVEPVKPEAF